MSSGFFHLSPYRTTLRQTKAIPANKLVKNVNRKANLGKFGRYMIAIPNKLSIFAAQTRQKQKL
uniref:Uncharacterized protein n=1 Tax=uncultured Prevotella sp. TaxID=159272 RepID=A0A6G8F147_9BACT|nr:hypothetical protein Prevot485_1540 [uncultured Prevotella sp.]